MNLEVRKGLPWWAMGLLGLMAMGVAFQLLFSLSAPYDEVHELAVAWRWAQGDLLYRDNFEFLGPLSISFSALAFYLWGAPSMELARLMGGVFAGLLLWGVARLAWQMGLPAIYALAAAAGVAFGAMPAFRAYFHHWVAWAFVVWALVLGARAIQKGPQSAAWDWGWAGLMSGLAMTCTGPRGLVAMGALGVACVLGAWAEALSWRRMVQHLGAMLVGVMLPWLVFGLYFAFHGAAFTMLKQVWWWPATHYRVAGGANDVWPLTDLDMRYFPMKYWGISPWAWASLFITGVGSGVLIFLAAPAAAFQSLLLIVRWRWQGFSPSRRAQMGLMLAVALVLECIHVLKGRSDLTHLRYAAPLALVAWALWSHQLVQQARRVSGSLRGSLWAPALAFFSFTALATASDWRSFRGEYRAGKVAWGLSQQFQAAPLVQAVRAHLPPEGRVVVYPGCAPVALFGGGRLSTAYTTLGRPAWRYHDASDYARFRQEWRAHPPDVVVISGAETQETMNDFGGDPNLKGYRFEGRFPGFRGDEASIYWLWVKEHTGGSDAGLNRP